MKNNKKGMLPNMEEQILICKPIDAVLPKDKDLAFTVMFFGHFLIIIILQKNKKINNTTNNVT